MPMDMSEIEPPPYEIQNIEIRPGMLIVSFSDLEKTKALPFPLHYTQPFEAGRDPEVDVKIREILQDVCELIDLGHVANRMPPETMRAGPPPT